MNIEECQDEEEFCCVVPLSENMAFCATKHAKLSCPYACKEHILADNKDGKLL